MRPLYRIFGSCIFVGLALAAGFVIAEEPEGEKVQAWDGYNPHITETTRYHTPSPVLVPEQQIPLRFFHDKHIEQEMACEDCHEDVADSIRVDDRNLPGGEMCSLCHELDADEPAQADPPSACGTCHMGFDGTYSGDDPHESPEDVLYKPAPMVVPTANLKFNHKVHLDRNISCETCHGDLSQIQTASPDNSLPVMGTCLTCHTGQDASDACSTCHTNDASGRLVTQFPEGELVPHGYYRNDAHNENFLQSHQHTSAEEQQYCENCHKPSFCVDCHNGVAKPVKIHPANWILIHSISARKNSLECASCHQSQNFCIDCHRRSGIVDLDPYKDPTLLSFHPAGWVNSPGAPPTATHHMFEAQRNIRACASCHEERTCLKCHSAKTEVGYGLSRARRVNPHPPNFRSRCRSMISLNERACMKCHEPADPNLLGCR